MDLLKKLNEDAAGGAVGGGAVAGFAYPMFARAAVIKRTMPASTEPKRKKKKIGLGLREAFIDNLGEDGSATFDQTEVLSKLRSLEKKDKVDRHNVATFGLEDKDGNIVRVSVDGEQAEEFEYALQSYLADEEDKNGGVPEIAEILFELRDRFNIIDVIWPEVEEDQEEGQAVAGEEGQPLVGSTPGAEGADQAGLEQPGAEMPPVDTGAPPEGDTQSLLTQVIDMMRTDAEARKAEAIARQREAEVRSQEAQNRTSKARVKQEEEMLDMENYFKQKNEMKKETKQLAKLAQWRNEVDDTENATVPNPEIDFADDLSKKEKKDEEEEEYGNKLQNLRGRVPPAQLASYILKRLK